MFLSKTLLGTSITSLKTTLIKNNIFFIFFFSFHLILIVYTKQIDEKWGIKDKFSKLTTCPALVDKLIKENLRCLYLTPCLAMTEPQSQNLWRERIWIRIVAAMTKNLIKSWFCSLRVVLHIIFFGQINQTFFSLI